MSGTVPYELNIDRAIWGFEEVGKQQGNSMNFKKQ